MNGIEPVEELDELTPEIELEILHFWESVYVASCNELKLKAISLKLTMFHHKQEFDKSVVKNRYKSFFEETHVPLNIK